MSVDPRQLRLPPPVRSVAIPSFPLNGFGRRFKLLNSAGERNRVQDHAEDFAQGFANEPSSWVERLDAEANEMAIEIDRIDREVFVASITELSWQELSNGEAGKAGVAFEVAHGEDRA